MPARPRKSRAVRDEALAERLRAEFWLGHLLNRSAGLLRERVGRALDSFGITPRAFGLLLEIGRREGHSQAELARRLGFDRTTMSQLVEELRAQGWIEREALEEDRRVNALCLTPRGEKRLHEAIEAADAIELEFASCLDADAIAALRRALQKVVARACDRDAPPVASAARGPRRRA